MNACTSEGRMASCSELLALIRKDIIDERLAELRRKAKRPRVVAALESAEAHIARALMYVKEAGK